MNTGHKILKQRRFKGGIREKVSLTSPSCPPEKVQNKAIDIVINKQWLISWDCPFCDRFNSTTVFTTPRKVKCQLCNGFIIKKGNDWRPMKSYPLREVIIFKEYKKCQKCKEELSMWYKIDECLICPACGGKRKEE